MNKNTLMLLTTGVVFIVTMLLSLGNTTSIGAQGCFIVTIQGPNNIQPGVLKIKKSDCVVWINFTGSAAQPEDVAVSFKEGEKCVQMTKAPVGFAMDVASGCYVTGELRYGETSSLMFTEPGTYNYEVQSKVGGKESGTIIVE